MGLSLPSAGVVEGGPRKLPPGRSFLSSFYPCCRGSSPDPFLPSGGATPSRPPMVPRRFYTAAGDTEAAAPRARSR
jgi:hypothetical protein